MLKFECPCCGNGLFFNNFHCLACNTEVSFSPYDFNFALTAESHNCQNRAGHGVCNWLSEPHGPFCLSCAANQVVPDLSIIGNQEKWKRLEEGKRRLIFTCLRLSISLRGLAFRFVAPTPDEPATTGHCEGVITVNIGEADPVTREATKQNLNEKLRTIIGHFRHEFGHYYWSQQIEHNQQALQRFRELFGDEREDYQACLDQHYSSINQASPEHISVYASAHPWEDWAETFAHYLHMRDALETAEEFGLAPRAGSPFDFDHGLLEWQRLSVAFNEINRSMGLQDLYPFAISDVVADKLRFIHEMVQPSPPQQQKLSIDPIDAGAVNPLQENVPLDNQPSSNSAGREAYSEPNAVGPPNAAPRPENIALDPPGVGVTPDPPPPNRVQEAYADLNARCLPSRELDYHQVAPPEFTA